MVGVHYTERFIRWIEGLRDVRGSAKIPTRIERHIDGNPAGVKPVLAGLAELRIIFDPGYRDYFLQGKQP